MPFSLTWLPEVLHGAGLKIAEQGDWRNRGRGEMGPIRGVMVHHTAGAASGNMPSLDLLVKGRPELPGPLCHLGLGRDGTFYIVAAGRANHAGAGRWNGIETGNRSFIGIEAENTGKDADQPWPAVQMDSLRRGVAALLAHIKAPAAMACGHKEYALPPGRKPDPRFDMEAFRAGVAAILAGTAAPAALIPAVDTQARATLRRGDRSQLVRTLQLALGVDPVGHFGPLTEAALRAFQRRSGLVPDGIAGPKTWQAIDKLVAGVPVSSVPAPPPPAPPTSTPSTSGLARASLAGMPIADDDAHKVTLDAAKRALGPDERVFATFQKGKGYYCKGATGIAALLRDDPEAARAVSPSAGRLVAAITLNEGMFEAVNSYDNSFMSFGVMQWTAGAGAAAGELGALLGRLKRSDPAAFHDCFGRYGLDTEAKAGATTGNLKLDGTVLGTAAAKAVFRSPTWAYRFWRAGHHPAVRRCQLQHAANRIDFFADTVIAGHRMRDWLSSELSMAMLLDEHVNRPGHVPRHFREALTAELAARTVPADPALWSTADEARVLRRYLAIRAAEPKSRMTDSDKRAERIFAQADQGKLARERGSFV